MRGCGAEGQRSSENDLGKPKHPEVVSYPQPLSPAAPLPRSRLQRLLLRRRKQHVVQDQPIPRAALVQRKIRRRVADGVLWILGIVSAEVGPGALSVIAVHVLR